MKKNCSNCQKELGDNWVNIIKVDWTVEEDEEGEIDFYINSQQSIGEFCKDCLTVVKDNYNNHIFDVNISNGAWRMSKCPWCEQSQGGVMYLQDCSRILDHYMECDKKKHLSPPSSKKKKKTESRIEELRRLIELLEAIVNRTPQQEQELQDKKQELAELEKQQSQNPNKTSYLPWIIGGVVLVLVIGAIIYLWKKQSSKE